MQRTFFFTPDVLSSGHRFCVFHPAKITTLNGEPYGMVLYAHPFAEEMNKSRHMAALQAREFSNAGFAVLQIDLLGCGDSSGEFADATWAAWINDLVAGYRWLEKKVCLSDNNMHSVPLWLWGLRAGCLLAADASNHIPRPLHFLFWQPSVSGKRDMTQFKRLERASRMMNAIGRETTESSKAELSTGLEVEILGYTVAHELEQGLALSALCPPSKPKAVQHMVWIEMAPRLPAFLSPASRQTLKLWEDSGVHTTSHLIECPAFWCGNEVQDSAALIAHTTSTVTCITANSSEVYSS